MTREEAKAWLEHHFDPIPDGTKQSEAVSLAIKALEQEPCEDAISRRAVLDIIRFEDKWLLDAKGHTTDTEIAFSGMRSKVSDLPPVNPQYTEDEIQKMQDIEQAEIEKAYELGKGEKQESEDAISRQAAIDRLKREEKVLYTPTGMNYLIRAIKELPPVNPQPKTGHWVFKKTIFDKFGNTVECSSCHKKWKTYDEVRWREENKYCPNCGIKMVEPQEKQCADCNHYGKLSLDCGRCDDDCSMYEPQESEYKEQKE